MQKMSLVVAALVVGAALVHCTQNSGDPSLQAGENPEQATPEQVKRGEYLVTIGGCNDCHSPKIMTEHGPEPDPTRLLSGHPSDAPLPKITDPGMAKPGQWLLFNDMFTSGTGPWGTSFAANLTPDDTGIGTWTFPQFKKAIREGKSKGLDGTRPLLPPMPWFNYALMSDEDLQAVYAYLRSLPPVKNVVPAALPPAP